MIIGEETHVTTVAFPLSAGRTVMSLSSLSVFKATFSLLLRMGGGGLALLSMLQTLPRRSLAASSLPIRQATPSTAAAMSIN